MKLKSKVAIVTGSSSHIGKEIALEFARQGAVLVINSRTNVEGGQSVADQIRMMGGHAIFVQADLTIPEQVNELFRATLHEFDRLDILVNNAGAAKSVAFLDSTREHWIESFDTNFLSAVTCSLEAVKLMQRFGSGKIINTASIRGLEHLGRPGLMAYSAAKAALINFTKTLAKEVAPLIQVNAVAPGFVITSNYDSVTASTKDEFIQGTLIKRWITPQEISDSYVLLASSAVITGEVLVVDGGYSLK